MKNGISGVALVTVIIFILLLSIIAIAMLTLMTNQATLIESQIRRVKAQYVAEAAFWKNFMNYALGVNAPPTVEYPAGSPLTINIDGIDYSAEVTWVDPNSISASVSY